MTKWFAVFMKVISTISYVALSGILVIGCAGILKKDFKTMDSWQMIGSIGFIGLSILLIKKYPEDK